MNTCSPAMLLIVDGLRADALETAHCPNIAALRRQGATTLRASSVMPSVTLPCHMSIFYSVLPARHGITTNEWMPMARPLPGLIDVAHTVGLQCASFYNWEPLRNLSQPGSLNVAYFRHSNQRPDGDQLIADQVARHFSNGCPDFAFVYFGTLDEIGHRVGFMSDGYMAQLRRVDDAIGTVIGALPPNATVLLTSDHGGHERSHGTEQPEDMTIPWIIAGPGVRRDYEIEMEVSLLDVAPTLARALGITPHPDWEGHCIDEVFE